MKPACPSSAETNVNTAESFWTSHCDLNTKDTLLLLGELAENTRSDRRAHTHTHTHTQAERERERERERETEQGK